MNDSRIADDSSRRASIFGWPLRRVWLVLFCVIFFPYCTLAWRAVISAPYWVPVVESVWVSFLVSSIIMVGAWTYARFNPPQGK